MIHNADEFVRKWMEFLAAPAGNVTLEYYDRNGNLQTVTFSNRNKLVQDLISSINNAMTKTFYVDAVNGNDANDGSANAPFATVAKAIESVPVGGLGIIILENGQTHVVNTAVPVVGKLIYLQSRSATSTPGAPDANSPILLFDDDGTSLIGQFKLRNSTIQVAGYAYPVKIRVGQLSATVGGVAFDGHTPSDGSTSNNYLSIAHTTVDVADGALLFNHVIKVSFRATTVTKHSSTQLTIGGVGFGTLEFQVSNTTIVDVNGNDISTQCIGGVVKDVNGVPRNIVSNIIF